MQSSFEFDDPPAIEKQVQEVLATTAGANAIDMVRCLSEAAFKELVQIQGKGCLNKPAAKASHSRMGR